ncbi:AAA family ATPase [Caulobacter sp. ErkDOM-E]|uniref:AAA family ATPase n=1 Tax=Caulobacter sp. ErkDOM-E TaxID=3402778 RepID=UPI003AF8676C
MLIVFGGLPGTGKTTIAQALARRLSATYLRIDEIEQALVAGGFSAADIGGSGYLVANALARSNLANGCAVVADCVNPVAESRAGWRAIADFSRTPLLEIEVICSNPDEHRRRIEGRQADISGHDLPTWDDVLSHDYTPWTEPRLLIDTAELSAQQAVELVEQHLA